MYKTTYYPVRFWVETQNEDFAKYSKQDIIQALLNSGWKIPWKWVYKVLNHELVNVYANGNWNTPEKIATSKLTGAYKLKKGGELYYKYQVIVFWKM